MLLMAPTVNAAPCPARRREKYAAMRKFALRAAALSAGTLPPAVRVALRGLGSSARRVSGFGRRVAGRDGGRRPEAPGSARAVARCAVRRECAVRRGGQGQGRRNLDRRAGRMVGGRGEAHGRQGRAGRCPNRIQRAGRPSTPAGQCTMSSPAALCSQCHSADCVRFRTRTAMVSWTRRRYRRC